MLAALKDFEGNFNAARDGNPVSRARCPLISVFSCTAAWRAGVRPRASNRVSPRINLCISGPCQPVRLHITSLFLAHWLLVRLKDPRSQKPYNGHFCKRPKQIPHLEFSYFTLSQNTPTLNAYVTHWITTTGVLILRNSNHSFIIKNTTRIMQFRIHFH